MNRRKFLKGLLTAAVSTSILSTVINNFPEVTKKVYDPSKVKIYWEGVEIEGFAPDTFITVTRT